MLSQDEGVNLAGVRRILQLYDQITALRARIAALQQELATGRGSGGERAELDDIGEHGPMRTA